MSDASRMAKWVRMEQNEMEMGMEGWDGQHETDSSQTARVSSCYFPQSRTNIGCMKSRQHHGIVPMQRVFIDDRYVVRRRGLCLQLMNGLDWWQ